MMLMRTRSFHKSIPARRELSTDLVVVGTHGRTGITKLLLGSVAEEVLRTAERDVLAVPPGASDKDRVAVKPSEVLVPGWIDNDIRNGDCFNANPRCF